MTKTITVSGNNVTLKADGDVAGDVSAVFATLDVVDRDNDVILPKAIGDQRVLMSSYGHGSWMGAMPIGKGRVFERGNEAVFEGSMFMDMDHAKQTFDLIKAVGDQQEWSFSLDNVDTERSKRGDQQVQLIKSVDVHEVSPVFRGAGINTRLLTAKSGDAALRAEIVRITADSYAKTADIERLNAELKQERNATARGLFQVVALS